MARPAGREGRKRPALETQVSKSVIDAIEKKPHSTYIKYLITKRCGSTFLIMELRKLGMSAPSRAYVTEYYDAVVDPLIHKHKLVKLYASYRSQLHGGTKGRAGCKILNFKLDVAEQPAVTQANFCRFIKELGVEIPWLWEIQRAYKTADNYPTDENGIRILSTTFNKTNVDKVASSKHRYIIEKLLLENLSSEAISRYCRENLKENITGMDINLFKEVFFNTRLNGIDENIELLEIELKYQQALLHDIHAGVKEYEDMTVGDRASMERQVQKRINELDENLMTLRAAHSDLSYNVKAASTKNFKEMFEDIAVRAYRKYCNYDNSNDRDVSTALSKVSKIMGEAYDKIEKIETADYGHGSLDDAGVTHALAELQQECLEDVEAEEKERANRALREAGLPELEDNIDMDQIGGVDELGMDFGGESENEEE